MKKIMYFLLSFTICLSLSRIANNQNVIFADENNVFIENVQDAIVPEDEIVQLADELEMEVYAFQSKREVSNVQLNSISDNSIQYKLETNYYFIPKAVNGYMLKQGSTAIVSAAARLNIDITYDYYIQNSSEYGRLISASGSVTNFNSGFSFVRADVNLGSSGPNYPSQAIYATTYSSSWYYSAPTNWGYNILGSGWTAIGSNVTAYITRDGSVIYSGSLGVTVS